MTQLSIRDFCNPWTRILALLEWSGVPTTNQFARQIGLLRAESLYRIKRGQNAISSRMADRIVARYPAISKGWLLSGEGPMLREKLQKQHFREQVEMEK